MNNDRADLQKQIVKQLFTEAIHNLGLDDDGRTTDGLRRGEQRVIELVRHC